MSKELGDLIDAALRRRAPLFASETITAVRLFHGRADGLDGLVIERWGPILITQIQEGPLDDRLNEIRSTIAALQDRLGTQAVYLKRFVRNRSSISAELDAAHHDATPWIGDRVAPEIEVQEGTLRFLIHPYEGFSVGLFLEHRDNRARVVRLAKDRSVLNLFSYTCGFSIAALSGGAATVDSVDVSRRYLEWGKRNLQSNGLDPAKARFFRSDTMDFYKRAERQGRRYDLIILDPPTFSKLRRPSRVFVLNEELERLISGAVQLLKSGGLILLSLNDRQIRMERMAEALLQAGRGRRSEISERPVLPLDFQRDPDFSKTLIAQFD